MPYGLQQVGGICPKMPHGPEIAPLRPPCYLPILLLPPPLGWKGSHSLTKVSMLGNEYWQWPLEGYFLLHTMHALKNTSTSVWMHPHTHNTHTYTCADTCACSIGHGAMHLSKKLCTLSLPVHSSSEWREWCLLAGQLSPYLMVPVGLGACSCR